MPAVVDNEHEPVVLVREPHDDETYVMTAFERHANHCAQCADPLRTHQEGRTLCDRGHGYAVDVADYIYSKNGKAYSAIAREHNQSTLIKVPRAFMAVRRLLLAVEEGLRLHRKQENQNRMAPIISYDSTYPIAPRRSSTQQPIQYHQIIESQPRTPKRRRVTIYPSTLDSRDSPSRGSLYDSDAADRIERNQTSSRVLRPSEYHR